MHIDLNYIFNYGTTLFKESIFPALTVQQKKILLVASIALGFLVALYVASRCCFQTRLQNKPDITPPEELNEGPEEITPSRTKEENASKILEQISPECQQDLEFEDSEIIENDFSKDQSDMNIPSAYLSHSHFFSEHPFLEQQFEIEDTNVATLAEATVIAFCETHNDEGGIERISKAIAQLYQKDDVVLVEVPKGEILSSKYKKLVLFNYPGLKEEMNILAWDINKSKYLHRLGKLVDHLHQLSDEIKKDREKALKQLSYEEIIDILESFIKLHPLLHRQVMEEKLQRNRGMAKIISKHLDKAIFIIAGGDHLISPSESTDNNYLFFDPSHPFNFTDWMDHRDDQRKSIESVRFVLEKTKYAILRPLIHS